MSDGSGVTPSPSSKLYELMTDRVQDYAIFLLDTSGRIMSWNTGARIIKRYNAEDVIGKHFSIFYTAADIARDWPAIELQRATREGRFEDEGWRVRKDGSRFWANVIITALRDDGGTLLAYSKITRDLTDRKRQEESLRQSEERFRLLVDGVQDYAIYMLDPNGIVTSWNLGARRIKGYEASEIIGKHFSRFYTNADIADAKPWSELAIARETGRAEDEGWRIRKDGSRFWARVVVTALYDGEGKLRGFAKVTQDLAQRRHAEALETSASNLNNFIAVLAHELRNPLAPIRNAVELQRMAKPGDPIQEKARQVIDRQAHQLTRIVEDLLDISRITRGTLSVEKKIVDLARIVERAVETSRPAIDGAHHTLEVALPATPLQVSGDELRLTQVFTNLLNNAARYTDPGGRILVTASAGERDNHPVALASVRDNGRGIEPTLLGSVFGMFVQGRDPLNRPAAGLGVGLALARSIVELHHGTLEGKSDGVGKGAEFVVTLPLIPQPETAAPAEESTEPAATDAKAKARRILIVDDNEDAASMLSMLLEKHGHEVLVTHDGERAVIAYEGFRPEVVFLDLGMPGMSGLEVARRLRERQRSPRPLIIAVTGWTKPEDETRSREAGFDLHLAKPVEELELLKILESPPQA